MNPASADHAGSSNVIMGYTVLKQCWQVCVTQRGPNRHSGERNGHISFALSTFVVRNVDAVSVCSHNHLPLTLV